MLILALTVILVGLITLLALTIEILHYLEGHHLEQLTDDELAESFTTYGNVEVRE